MADKISPSNRLRLFSKADSVYANPKDQGTILSLLPTSHQTPPHFQTDIALQTAIRHAQMSQYQVTLEIMPCPRHIKPETKGLKEQLPSLLQGTALCHWSESFIKAGRGLCQAGQRSSLCYVLKGGSCNLPPTRFLGQPTYTKHNKALGDIIILKTLCMTL